MIRKILTIVLLVMVFATLTACKNNEDIACSSINDNCSECDESNLIKPQIVEEEKYYKIIESENSKIYYSIYSESGETVFEEFMNYKPLKISMISSDIIEIRKGMGANATLHRYYHINRDSFSKEYQNIIEISDELCVYLDTNQKLIVRNIFDKTKYYKEFEFDIAKKATAIYSVEFLENNTKLKVVYYSSADDSLKEKSFILY
jgi:hypothetical protein